MSEYNRKYYEKNKEKLKANARKLGKIYYKKNKAKILARSANYYSKNKESVNARVKKHRELNKEKRLVYEADYRDIHKDIIRQKYQENINVYRRYDRLRKSIRREIVGKIQLYYGCKNPNCKWDGNFHPSQLDFHHFDPNKKIERVASMLNYSLKKIADEINKCIVLCRNCHMLYHATHYHLDETMLCHVNEKLEIKT